MSVKMMTAVFGIDAVPLRKLLLIALADHADDDGENVWPSVPYLSWKTNLSESGVRKLMKRFRDDGVLIAVDREGGGRRRSVIYRLNLDALPAKEAFARERKGASPVGIERVKGRKKPYPA